MNAKEAIKATGGRFVAIDFVKKNGERRHMVCRLGVAKHVTGKGMAYKPEDRGLMTAWDSVKKAYRTIPLDRVLSVKSGSINWRAA